jgi:hypothetical protein
MPALRVKSSFEAQLQEEIRAARRQLHAAVVATDTSPIEFQDSGHTPLWFANLSARMDFLYLEIELNFDAHFCTEEQRQSAVDRLDKIKHAVREGDGVDDALPKSFKASLEALHRPWPHSPGDKQTIRYLMDTSGDIRLEGKIRTGSVWWEICIRCESIGGEGGDAPRCVLKIFDAELEFMGWRRLNESGTGRSYHDLLEKLTTAWCMGLLQDDGGGGGDDLPPIGGWVLKRTQCRRMREHWQQLSGCEAGTLLLSCKHTSSIVKVLASR